MTPQNHPQYTPSARCVYVRDRWADNDFFSPCFMSHLPHSFSTTTNKLGKRFTICFTRNKNFFFFEKKIWNKFFYVCSFVIAGLMISQVEIFFLLSFTLHCTTFYIYRQFIWKYLLQWPIIAGFKCSVRIPTEKEMKTTCLLSWKYFLKNSLMFWNSI